jgi:hypothetical protein
VAWTCPDCDAKLVSKNLSHSCIRRTVDDFFADKPPAGVAFAKAFIEEARKLGPVTLHPVKTRIALMVEVRFAAINRIGKTSIRAHLWLKEKPASTRFDRVDDLGGDFVCHFTVSDDRPIDAELRRFLAKSYAIGQRRHLRKR